jgi:membrane-bound ClpP family serine protease
MLKEKALIYLQILSAVGATFVISALKSPGRAASGVIGITGVLAAVLGSFHIANGFVNACITLGISVSPKTKLIVKILSWIIAVFSMLQIVILFL